MEKKNLIKILDGDIACIDTVNIQDPAPYETEVIIKPEHVRKMLLGFMAGKCSAGELTKWAFFICMRGEYCCEKDHPDDEDYYVDMFYVIQRLSTPQLDGEVNEEQVRLYLSELDKYFK